MTTRRHSDHPSSADSTSAPDRPIGGHPTPTHPGPGRVNPPIAPDPTPYLHPTHPGPAGVNPPIAPMPRAPGQNGWGANVLAPAGAMGNPPRLAAITKPSGAELWWLGADGVVTGVWTDPGTPWAAYALSEPGSAAPDGGITAISKGGDAMEVWWIGADGSVQAAWHDGDWRRYQLADPGSAATTGGITSIFKGNDQMEVWWIGPDGSVQAAYHDGDWGRYALAGPGEASPTGGIAAISKGGDVMEVWWAGADGSIQAAWHDSDWHRYTLAGAGAAAPTTGVTAVSKGKDLMEVWWVGADGSVQGAWHDSDWQYYALTGPGVASTTCRPSSWFGNNRRDVTMRVWWVGPTGGAWQAAYDSSWVTTLIGDTAHPSGAIAGFTLNPETVGVCWGGADGSLIDGVPDEVTLLARVSGGRGLRGIVGLTLRADGSSEWYGDVTNDEPYGYNYAVSAFATGTGLRVDLSGAHQGSVAGWAEPGAGNDMWSTPHPGHPALAGGLGGYRFGTLQLRLEHSVDIVDYLESVIGEIFDIAATLAMTKIGAFIVIGAELVSLISTGSLVPGAVLVGGTPWLTGPGGLFTRMLVDAAGDGGRELSQEEYDWANDMVFAGALPPRDSLYVTNYTGIGGRPFTFPTDGGPTLLNLGPALYADPRNSGGETFVHELTHACQIAHRADVLFIATAMITQAANSLGSDVYDYEPAGFDYTSQGLEAQAQIVEDWYRGTPTQAHHPEDRGFTGIPRDPQSPYYRYLTDNVRLGRF